LKRPARDKRSSLFYYHVGDEEKSFINGDQVINVDFLYGLKMMNKIGNRMCQSSRIRPRSYL